MAKKRYLYAVWRRKSSSAVIKLYPKGTGKYTIRKGDDQVSIEDYFGGHKYMIEDCYFPFTILGDKAQSMYDAEIVVRGWGLMGQAEAIRLGFARALVEHNESNRLTLKPHGLLVRDPRVKERKKPGRRKARKKPEWSKR